MADRAIPFNIGMQYANDSGTILNGGFLYFYEAGTSTAKTTWSDSAMQTANANPVVLDSGGRATIFVRGLYKAVLKDSAGTTIGTWDYLYFPTITTVASTLLDDTSVANMRSTLGLGTAAVLDVGTSGSNVVQLTAAAKYPAADGSLITNIASSASVPKNYLTGYTISRSENQTLGIAAGVAKDSTNAYTMSLSSAWTKTLGSWSAGDAGGALDTGTAAINDWYYVFAIYNATTSASDILFSTNPTSPSMPTGWAYRRRIGAFLTDASVYIVDFSQDGDEFLWKSAPLSVNLDGTLSNTGANYALTVPANISVRAIINISGAHGSVVSAIYASSPDVDNEATDYNGNTRVGALNTGSTTGETTAVGGVIIRTNTSGEIRLRSSSTTTYCGITTLGWLDDRDRA